MIRIRSAIAADVPAIHHLLSQLAEFEQDVLHATPQDLLRDGFGDQPRFQALLAELPDGAAVGLLIYFPIYSSWRGHGGAMIHDLFVSPAARGQSVGRRLVQHVADVVRQQGGGRLDVCVLDWNQSARRFYQSLGLQPQTGWMIYRADQAAVEQLATAPKHDSKMP